MSAVVLSSCGDSLDAAQCAEAFGDTDLQIRIDVLAQNIFEQINGQLDTVEVCCPICSERITRIESDAEGKFPLSDQIFGKTSIAPLQVSLSKTSRSEEKVPSVISFKRVELSNIVNGGRDSMDEGETYRRLAELANDFNGLVSMLGGILGRAMYYLPVSWKAHVYIRGMQESKEKDLPGCSWILTDELGKTIGDLSLTAVDKSKFDLDEDISQLSLYNVGVLLHSDFQRRGVVTQVTEHLYEVIERLKISIDGLWIATRPDNTGVNHIAQKLNFEFIKQMDVQERGLLPCFSSNTIPYNLYVKRFA